MMYLMPPPPKKKELTFEEVWKHTFNAFHTYRDCHTGQSQKNEQKKAVFLCSAAQCSPLQPTEA